LDKNNVEQLQWLPIIWNLPCNKILAAKYMTLINIMKLLLSIDLPTFLFSSIIVDIHSDDLSDMALLSDFLGFSEYPSE
jgi:hypothetical protein